jgi:hypothetical protein
LLPLALFFINAIFAFNDSPPVNSAILFNKNGVMSLPFIFFSLQKGKKIYFNKKKKKKKKIFTRIQRLHFELLFLFLKTLQHFLLEQAQQQEYLV